MSLRGIALLAGALLFGCGDCGDEASNNANGAPNNGVSNANANNQADMGGQQDTGGGGSGNTLSVSLPPASAGFGPVTLAANNPVRIPLTFSIPTGLEVGSLEVFAVDAQKSADLMTIVRTDGGATPDPTVHFRLAVVAGSDGDAACNSADAAVDLTITGNDDFSEKTAVDTGSGASSLRGPLAGGEFSACFEMEASVNVELTLVAAVDVEFDSGCDTPPEPVAGRWGGTYTCGDSCTGVDEAGDVDLTIIQAGETAIYFDDGAAFYFGSVCGDAFSFYGGAATYSEWGKFTRTGATSGVKTSHWMGNLAMCGGDCDDELTLR